MRCNRAPQTQLGLKNLAWCMLHYFPTAPYNPVSFGRADVENVRATEFRTSTTLMASKIRHFGLESLLLWSLKILMMMALDPVIEKGPVIVEIHAIGDDSDSADRRLINIEIF